MYQPHVQGQRSAMRWQWMLAAGLCWLTFARSLHAAEITVQHSLDNGATWTAAGAVDGSLEVRPLGPAALASLCVVHQCHRTALTPQDDMVTLTRQSLSGAAAEQLQALIAHDG
jgi:hypothetical protein